MRSRAISQIAASCSQGSIVVFRCTARADRRDARAFALANRTPYSWNRFRMGFRRIELPQREVNVADIARAMSSSVESVRREFAGNLGVARREKLHFVERAPIARRPRHQRHRAPMANSTPARTSFNQSQAATISR